MTHNYDKGFTLIELLVVICIIGLILTVATPMYSEYKKRGYISTMKSDLNIIRTAQELYYSENDNYLAVGDLKEELTSYGFKNFSNGNSAGIEVLENEYTVTVSSSKTSSKVLYSSKTGLTELK
ncbi:MAG: prepilin-type N-terminal cleavage/methylation domain-containing protein [Desulfobacterales bacterium]|nr:prepilin-type N-terminal cleavage/methylation domain-containing protein [Desulfobacterales bacterium]